MSVLEIERNFLSRKYCFRAKKRRGWDSNPCGPEGPRALKARALTTLPPRLSGHSWVSCLFLFSVPEQYFHSVKIIKCVPRGVLMGNIVEVSLNRELLDAIFEGARRLYPRETFLLLRGKKTKNLIHVTDLVVPPLTVYGYGFANFPLHMLPMDFSLVGTVHSHPSGNVSPSNVDLNHFFGRILMIVGCPIRRRAERGSLRF